MEQESIILLKQLHPLVEPFALDAYSDAIAKTPTNVHPVITQTVRTFAQSDYLYSLGRTVVNPDGRSSIKPWGNIVTNARAGQSYHNYALALDFALFEDGKEEWIVDVNWMIVVECFKRKGFVWGGDFTNFKDDPHFEMRFGINWRDLLVMHNNNNFIAGTSFLNIQNNNSIA
jgi:peptidoglycan L-alanyl-D-glutamate endopeptidase CwlK